MLVDRKSCGFPCGRAYDPRKTAEGQIKLTATLDGSPAWWIYTGCIYAARPVAVLAIAGCESHWAQRHDDGSFTATGITASFSRDPANGVFLDRFANFFTGRTVAVQPNVLAGGRAVYPADGGSARALGHIRDAAVAPGGFARADPDRPLGGRARKSLPSIARLHPIVCELAMSSIGWQAGRRRDCP